MAKFKPLTKQQLKDYFQDYRQAFPDWTVEHDVMLTRAHGPIKQIIDFQAPRAGTYRPSCAVAVLPTPEFCHLLNKWLDVKHREVLPREHAAKRPKVLKAMEEQFLPPIREPLDIAKVVQLAEEEVERDRIDNINFSTGLAVLNAYIGIMPRALFWCQQVDHQTTERGAGLAEWESRQAQFVRQLRQALQSDRGHTFLQAAMSRQK